MGVPMSSSRAWSSDCHQLGPKAILKRMRRLRLDSKWERLTLLLTSCNTAGRCIPQALTPPLSEGNYFSTLAGSASYAFQKLNQESKPRGHPCRSFSDGLTFYLRRKNLGLHKQGPPVPNPPGHNQLLSHLGVQKPERSLKTPSKLRSALRRVGRKAAILIGK